MKIKVTKCDNGNMWYKSHIGETFEVNDEHDDVYSVNHVCYYEYEIYKDDCEVVTETQWLTKKEALKLAIDGAKVANEAWTSCGRYVSFDGKNFRFGESNMIANGVLDYEDHWYLWTPPQPKFTVADFVQDDVGDYGRIVSMEYKGNTWMYKLSDCVDNDDLWTKAEGDIEVA